MAKMLVLHLSDIHATSPSDPALSRSSRVVSAIQNIDSGFDAIFIVVSGDLANAGRTEEFNAVGKFLAELSAIIPTTESLIRPDGLQIVPIIVVPGNHDCNFEGDQSERDRILGDKLDYESLLIDGDTLDSVSAVQDEFFDFFTRSQYSRFRGSLSWRSPFCL